MQISWDELDAMIVAKVKKLCLDRLDALERIHMPQYGIRGHFNWYGIGAVDRRSGVERRREWPQNRRRLSVGRRKADKPQMRQAEWQDGDRRSGKDRRG